MNKRLIWFSLEHTHTHTGPGCRVCLCLSLLGRKAQIKLLPLPLPLLDAPPDGNTTEWHWEKTHLTCFQHKQKCISISSESWSDKDPGAMWILCLAQHCWGVYGLIEQHCSVLHTATIWLTACNWETIKAKYFTWFLSKQFGLTRKV